MSHPRKSLKQHSLNVIVLSCSVLLALLLAACGGAGTPTGTAAPSFSSRNDASTNQNGSNAATSQPQTDQQGKPTQKSLDKVRTQNRYLIKSLALSMEMKDTKKVADELLTWITTTDPDATTAGTDYQQEGDNLYHIKLTFSVSAKMYSQVYTYLRDYAPNHKGSKLLTFQESVQDVTNDYVDTGSRLANLRKEQGRLQELMGRAQNLNDITVIEDKLTTVEGNIESIEAHLNALKDQTTFYNVTVTLQPADVVATPPPPSGWSFGQVLHDAFAASLGFAQGLLTFLVWLLAFSVYVIPVGVIVWVIIRLRTRFRGVLPPTPKTEVE